MLPIPINNDGMPAIQPRYSNKSQNTTPWRDDHTFTSPSLTNGVKGESATGKSIGGRAYQLAKNTSAIVHTKSARVERLIMQRQWVNNKKTAKRISDQVNDLKSSLADYKHDANSQQFNVVQKKISNLMKTLDLLSRNTKVDDSVAAHKDEVKQLKKEFKKTSKNETHRRNYGEDLKFENEVKASDQKGKKEIVNPTPPSKVNKIMKKDRVKPNIEELEGFM